MLINKFNHGVSMAINDVVAAEIAPVALAKKNQSLDSSLRDGSYDHVYEGYCANNGGNGNGEGIPLTITLAYNTNDAGNVRSIKFRVAGGSDPAKLGSFELVRFGTQLKMNYSRGLTPDLLIKENPYTIQPAEKNIKHIEQINKIMIAVINEYKR